MKVRVSFTVEVDPAAWVEAYGVERSEVRRDVNALVMNAVRSNFDDLGLTLIEEGTS